LVKLQNISLQVISSQSEIKLTEQLSVTPLQVPHRDEYSETVGYIIKSNQKSVLFIPDIDKWDKWDLDINDIIKTVDYAFLDGSFYQNGEIPGRDMSQIPHPFITESMERFNVLEKHDREKVYFIHLNHTNPLLNRESVEFAQFSESDFNLAQEGDIISL
jgi:pyrroloquinoline quinone biosynthesis protein B